MWTAFRGCNSREPLIAAVVAGHLGYCDRLRLGVCDHVTMIENLCSFVNNKKVLVVYGLAVPIAEQMLTGSPAWVYRVASLDWG